jgi:hypothetical protein
VHAGYERSAHDAAVYRDALTKGFLRVPAGKYLLGDAGYTERDGFDNTELAPYQKVRYHLQEWRHAANGPRTAEELFNLRHAFLRNVVERVFGVVEWRFQMLQSNMLGYDIKTQIKLVYALTDLHNFLNKTGSNPETDWQAMRNEAAAIRSREVEVNSSILYAVQDQSARRRAIAEFM